MATIGNAVTSVMDVITSTSGTLVSTVNTVAGGMSMLNDFVGAQRTMQTKRLAITGIEYDDVLMETAALDALKREEKIKAYVGNDTAKADSYTKHFARLSAALEAAKAPVE